MWIHNIFRKWVYFIFGKCVCTHSITPSSHGGRRTNILLHVDPLYMRGVLVSVYTIVYTHDTTQPFIFNIESNFTSFYGRVMQTIFKLLHTMALKWQRKALRCLICILLTTINFWCANSTSFWHRHSFCITNWFLQSSNLSNEMSHISGLKEGGANYWQQRISNGQILQVWWSQYSCVGIHQNKLLFKMSIKNVLYSNS